MDTDGVSRGFINRDGSPQIVSKDYYEAVGKGLISGATPWTRLGFTPTMNTTESDIWSAAGVYVFSTEEETLEVLSNNAQDDSTVLAGDATGDTVESTGGSTTSLEDTEEDFTDDVDIGDCVILDPHGASPEWGYVTGVAENVLTVAGGFSSGGTGSGRKYAVLDKSAWTGAQAVFICYLKGDYSYGCEIVCMNGVTAVDTINTNYFRVNHFRIIATGSNNKAVGTLTLRVDGGGVTKGNITAGFTRERSSIYTVQAGKTLYIYELEFSFGYAANQTHYARLYTRANIEPRTKHNTGAIFYPYSEVICANSSHTVKIDIPTVIPEKTDIRVSGIASVAGIATAIMRGWLEDD
jgi:hypothetical protein